MHRHSPSNIQEPPDSDCDTRVYRFHGFDPFKNEPIGKLSVKLHNLLKFTKEKLAAVIAQGEREFRDALFEEDEEEAARVLKVATDPIKRRIDFVKRQLDYLDEEVDYTPTIRHLNNGTPAPFPYPFVENLIDEAGVEYQLHFFYPFDRVKDEQGRTGTVTRYVPNQVDVTRDTGEETWYIPSELTRTGPSNFGHSEHHLERIRIATRHSGEEYWAGILFYVEEPDSGLLATIP